MTTAIAPTETYSETLSIEFRAMGTDWYVEAVGVSDEKLAYMPVLVEREEQRYSRFRDDSLLSQLNRERSVSDGMLALLAAEAQAIQRATGGAFNAAVGDAVIAAGYRCDFAELSQAVTEAAEATEEPSAPELRIAVSGSQVRLEGDGQLDLGGIAKGWTADLVARFLRGVGAKRWLVDAGGDIAMGGPEAEERLIAVALTGLTIGVREGAVATSSTLKRAWDTPRGRKHHIIDAARGVPTEHEYVLATVLAPCAATADALATAMLAEPELGDRALAEHEAQAILVTGEGDAFMSPGMSGYLR